MTTMDVRSEWLERNLELLLRRAPADRDAYLSGVRLARGEEAAEALIRAAGDRLYEPAAGSIGAAGRHGLRVVPVGGVLTVPAPRARWPSVRAVIYRYARGVGMRLRTRGRGDSIRVERVA
ncbi:MAG: hypothetical protein IT514_15480 [Burkholderiales bacterium]|nr:hypothetical protein [Burkholderiales bacterium]